MACRKNMSFRECELAILRSAVDEIGNKTGKQKLNNPDIKEIILIVEDFLKQLGGFATVVQLLIIFCL